MNDEMLKCQFESFLVRIMLLQSLGHLKGLLYDEGVIIDDPVTFP